MLGTHKAYRLLSRRNQGGHRQRYFITPCYFIMHKISDAERIVYTPALFQCQSLTKRLAKARIKYIVELAPIALRAFQPFGTVTDGAHIGCLAHQIDITVRPEQSALRVHHPPLALVLFGAEKARCLEPGAGGPAAVFVTVARPWMSGKVIALGLTVRNQFF